ncbi:MAG: hypothetical protein LBV34_25985 [Nocardiopsaceae bacterium]|nr:hypothetical protein [Nocardiopsaceae bacterium]
MTEAWEQFEYLRLLLQEDARNYIGTPHLLVSGMRGDHRPQASQCLGCELVPNDQHPLLRADFLGGGLEGITTAQKTVNVLRDRCPIDHERDVIECGGRGG